VADQRSEAKQLKSDYQAAFTGKEGRRCLEDILKYCHVLEPLNGAVDTNSIILREGRRDVALTILQKLNWNEKDFLNLTEGVEHE